MSVAVLVLLVAAAGLLIATEWPRVPHLGVDARPKRRRKRRRSKLRVVPDPGDSDEFARSVERDLARLPTIDPRDAKKR